MKGAMIKSRICAIKRPRNFSKVRWMNFRRVLRERLDQYCDKLECSDDSIKVITRIDDFKGGPSVMYGFFSDFCEIMDWEVLMSFDTIEWFKTPNDKVGHYTDREYDGGHNENER